jgi:PilZ domain
MPNSRLDPRFRCEGGVAIQVPGSNKRLWGRLSDLSRSGLYMETAEPWQVGTEVEIHLDCCGNSIHAKGRIVTSHPGVGLGIVLQEIQPQSEAEFEALLAQLAQATDTEGHASTV